MRLHICKGVGSTLVSLMLGGQALRYSKGLGVSVSLGATVVSLCPSLLEASSRMTKCWPCLAPSSVQTEASTLKAERETVEKQSPFREEAAIITQRVFSHKKKSFSFMRMNSY